MCVAFTQLCWFRFFVCVKDYSRSLLGSLQGVLSTTLGCLPQGITIIGPTLDHLGLHFAWALPCGNALLVLGGVVPLHSIAQYEVTQ
jgi:hypothetical protein